jgi:hypothetical protein
MKVYDIISEDKEVAEAPVGMLKRAGQAVAGKVSSTAARKGEVSKEANEVFKELKVQFKGSEFDLNKLPVDRFASFMDKKGYGDGIKQEIEKFTDADDPESTLDKKQIETIVLKQTQSAAASDSRTQKGKFASGKGSQKGGKGSAGSKGASPELKKVADAVSKMSDAEKQELAKLI